MREIMIAYSDGYKEKIHEKSLANGTTIEYLLEGFNGHYRSMTFWESTQGKIYTRVINLNHVVRFNVYEV